MHANRLPGGLSAGQLCRSLDFTPEQLERALDADPGTNPADVWLLRDFPDHVFRDRGLEPHPFTVLTEVSRGAARMRFGLREVPPTPPAGA